VIPVLASILILVTLFSGLFINQAFAITQVDNGVQSSSPITTVSLTQEAGSIGGGNLFRTTAGFSVPAGDTIQIARFNFITDHPDHDAGNVIAHLYDQDLNHVATSDIQLIDDEKGDVLYEFTFNHVVGAGTETVFVVLQLEGVFDQTHGISKVVSNLQDDAGHTLFQDNCGCEEGTVYPNPEDPFVDRIDFTGAVGKAMWTELDIISILDLDGGSSSAYEVPTIGLNNKGMPVVKCGVMFDLTCFDITSKFHYEFELYEMMSGTHSIAITTYCAQGVDKCNYTAIGIMPYSEDWNNPTWKIEVHKDHLGNLTLVKNDPEGFLGEVTVTANVVGGKFWLVTFTVEFMNKDTEPMKFAVQVRDIKHGVQNTYLNEGVQFKDADAYPYVETAYEKPLKVKSLCIEDDVFHRYTCAFEKVKEWTIRNAEETMRQILNNEYTYK